MYAFISSIGLISPQNTCFHDYSCGIDHQGDSVLHCIEPPYKELINPIQLRRMSRILKLGLGAAQLCLHRAHHIEPDAVIAGTGLACVSDLEQFLQMMMKDEGAGLSPIPFINSSHNMVTAQIAKTLNIHGYNNTHCNRRLSFEHALLDGLMLLNEQTAEQVLVGGIDEYNGAYHRLMGTPVAGEGAGFFLINRLQGMAKIEEVQTWHGPMNRSIDMKGVDALFFGTNGDAAEELFYQKIAEEALSKRIAIHPYKRYCGEYPTSSAFALALASESIRLGRYNKILIYNQYWGQYHGLISIRRSPNE